MIRRMLLQTLTLNVRVSPPFKLRKEQQKHLQSYSTAMANAQRIYPANENVERARKISHGDHPPANRYQLKDVTFPKEQMVPSRAPHRQYYPVLERRPRNTCCRCLVWTFCILLLFVVTIAITAAILYAAFKPKAPDYSVDNIQITRFSLGLTGTVSSQFAVDVTARNPNTKIGIYYTADSYLGVLYSGAELCKGKLPGFYQGHRNITNLHVTLTGNDVQITREMVRSLTAQRQLGSIPLLLKADVPVKVKFGKLKTMKITFRVRCDLVINSLDANASINITKKNCKVKL